MSRTVSIWKEVEVDIDLADCAEALENAGYKVTERSAPQRGLPSEVEISPELKSALAAIETVSIHAENVVHRTALVVAYRVLLEELT